MPAAGIKILSICLLGIVEYTPSHNQELMDEIIMHFLIHQTDKTEAAFCLYQRQISLSV